MWCVRVVVIADFVLQIAYFLITHLKGERETSNYHSTLTLYIQYSCSWSVYLVQYYVQFRATAVHGHVYV